MKPSKLQNALKSPLRSQIIYVCDRLFFHWETHKIYYSPTFFLSSSFPERKKTKNLFSPKLPNQKLMLMDNVIYYVIFQLTPALKQSGFLWSGSSQV